MLNQTYLFFQRVMPSSFFVLLRFFLRVDGVLIRMNDTRLHHEVNPCSSPWIFYRCSLAVLLSEKTCWYSCNLILIFWAVEVTRTELSSAFYYYGGAEAATKWYVLYEQSGLLLTWSNDLNTCDKHGLERHYKTKNRQQ